MAYIKELVSCACAMEPDYSMRLDIMNADKKKAIGYCLKEVKVNAYGHFNSDRFVFSSELFGLNHSTAM